MVQSVRLQHVPVTTTNAAFDEVPRSGVTSSRRQRLGAPPGAERTAPQIPGVEVSYRRRSRPTEETPANPTLRMLGALYRIALAGGFE